MRSALLSRSLTRPLSAGKGRSRRVDRVLACSASGPLLTPHTRRQGYFRPRGPDTSHLGASSPFQRRSTLAFAEDSCRCRHATAPRAAKSTTSTQCLCATPFVGHRILAELGEACNSACTAHPTPSWATTALGLVPTLVTQGLHSLHASWDAVFRCMSDTVLAASRPGGWRPCTHCHWLATSRKLLPTSVNTDVSEAPRLG